MTKEEAKALKKASKQKIKVDFERTNAWERFKLKYLTWTFIKKVLWFLLRFLLLLGIAYVILYPFISKIFGSFMSRQDLVDVSVKLIPKYPNLDIYTAILEENKYWEAFTNTFILSLVTATIQTFICAVVGYGFAKFKFKGNSLMFGCVMLAMIVPPRTLTLAFINFFNDFKIFGLIPVGENVNLLNTYWPFLLLCIGALYFKNGLYVFMLRQFYKGVPDELEEAAYIDGSGVFKTFIRIILPLSVPMMITVFIFSFAWQWTDTFYSGLFFTNQGNYLITQIVKVPGSLADSTFVAQGLYNNCITNTCGLLIILPLILIYCFCQKYIVQGIERSGIVG